LLAELPTGLDAERLPKQECPGTRPGRTYWHDSGCLLMRADLLDSLAFDRGVPRPYDK
jgi:hypothetical protein